MSAWNRTILMMPAARSTIGDRVAATRVARRMTQQQLSEAASVLLSMLRKIEQGSRHPGDLSAPDTLVSYARWARVI